MPNDNDNTEELMSRIAEYLSSQELETIYPHRIDYNPIINNYIIKSLDNEGNEITHILSAEVMDNFRRTNSSDEIEKENEKKNLKKPKPQKPQLLTGLEIESIVNEKKLDVRVSGYHASDNEHEDNESYFGKYWKCERDGSLHEEQTDFGGGEKPVEFISYILKGKDEYFNAIEDFKKHIKKGSENLLEVIDFNKSCGCHIHIGLSKMKQYYEKIDMDILKQMRDLFFQEIDNSDKLSKDTKEKVKKHYFRDYSKKTTRVKYMMSSDRYQEFNKETDIDCKGIEWRSFNIHGVKDWDEFDEMFRIAYTCVEFLYNKRINGYELDRKAIRIKRKKWKGFLDKNNGDDNREVDLGEFDEIMDVDNVPTDKEEVKEVDPQNRVSYDLSDEINRVVEINEV